VNGELIPKDTKNYDRIPGMPTVQGVLFVIATGLICYISRAYLRQPCSHGFYRFFAWEIILVLFIRNLPFWFVDPLAWHQIISWILLIICCVPVVLGIYMLKKAGKARAVETAPQRQDEPLFEFEKTTSLVTGGIYRTIRHPLYSSLLLLAWGIYFKQPDLTSLILAVADSLLLYVTARIEEQENIRYFGQEYRDYMRHTRRFIPFLF
jgi:protein-S-isoprenylcysteine O-methyltransferase Ste14